MSGDWGWTDGAQELASYGATAGSTANVTITAPGTDNTKGAWAEVCAAAPFNAVGLLFCHEFSATSGVVNGLVDIAIGAASSEVVVIANIPVQRYASDLGWAPPMLLPCSIPEGARVAMRYQAVAVSGTPVLLASATLVPAGNSYSIGAGKVETYGADTANSIGTVVDPGASANTKGAWTQLTASTTIRSKWMLLHLLGHTTKNNYLRYRFDLAIGGSGSEVAIVSDLFHYTGSAPGGAIRIFMPLALPLGVRVSARCQTTNTTSGTRQLVATLHAMG